ncbi:hypothetical protein CVT26_003601, partial [Gymnopilus dilepis]
IQRQRQSNSAGELAPNLGLLASVTSEGFTQISGECKSRFEQRNDCSLWSALFRSGPLLNVILNRLQKASYTRTIKISPHLSSPPRPFLSSLTMSFLGLGNTLGINGANFGAGRAGPQVHDGPQLPSSYYHPGLNIAHASFSSSSVPRFSLPLHPGHASFSQQIGDLSSGKGAKYTLPGGSMVAGHDFFSQGPTFVGSPQALSQLPTTPFPPTSSWNLPSGNVVNTPTLGAPPHHVRSSAGLSATSLVLPPASTRFQHLQNSPVTWVMLEDQRSDLGLAGIEAFGHPSSIGISSHLADPATIVFHDSSASQGLQPGLYPCTTANSDVLNYANTSLITGIPDNDFDASFQNDSSANPSSSNTLAADGSNTQSTGDYSTEGVPLGNPHIALDPAMNPNVPFAQFALPDMIDIVADRGEAKQTTTKYFDHGSDSGLLTSSRDVSVELQQCHDKHHDQSIDANDAFSVLVNQQETKPRNEQAQETQDYSRVPVRSSYSELAHALIQTPTTSPTSPSSSTSSSPSHTAFPAPPPSVVPFKTLPSTSEPATIRQNDQPDETPESGSASSHQQSQQKDGVPQSPVYSATHPPSQTAAKKRKFDEMEGSMSSFPVTSALQAASDPQSLEASMVQSRDVDPKLKRGRGRPRKVDPPPQRKGFRPIVPREPIPPRMMTAQSPPIPSSSSGPSFRRAERKDHKPAHGLKCPISAAESRQGLQEMTDLDYQARGSSPLRGPPQHARVSEPFTGLSASSSILPLTSITPKHLHNPPITRVMLEDKPSVMAEEIRGNSAAQEDFWSLSSTHANLGLGGTRAVGHQSSFAGRGISSHPADPATTVFQEMTVSQPNWLLGTTADSNVLNDEYMAFMTGISDNGFDLIAGNDNSMDMLSSKTLHGYESNMQSASNVSAAVLPPGNAFVALDSAASLFHVPYPQFALPDVTTFDSHQGEANKTTNLSFDQWNDTGLVTRSRDISVERPQDHVQNSSQSGLVGQQQFQLSNLGEPQNQNFAGTHVSGSYSEPAHALTPVVTPASSVTSSTLPTPSSPSHVPSTTPSSGLVPAIQHLQQGDNGPKSADSPAAPSPAHTDGKKRKRDGLNNPLSSSPTTTSPATSSFQDETDAQPSGTSLGLSDESEPKPKRKRGRPRKFKPQPSPWKGFRPIAARPSPSSSIMIAQSTALSPIPSDPILPAPAPALAIPAIPSRASGLPTSQVKNQSRVTSPSTPSNPPLSVDTARPAAWRHRYISPAHPQVLPMLWPPPFTGPTHLLVAPTPYAGMASTAGSGSSPVAPPSGEVSDGAVALHHPWDWREWRPDTELRLSTGETAQDLYDKLRREKLAETEAQ